MKTEAVVQAKPCPPEISRSITGRPEILCMASCRTAYAVSFIAIRIDHLTAETIRDGYLSLLRNDQLELDVLPCDLHYVCQNHKECILYLVMTAMVDVDIGHSMN